MKNKILKISIVLFIGVSLSGCVTAAAIAGKAVRHSAMYYGYGL